MNLHLEKMRGAHLTRWAAAVGVKRRWLGLESDYKLRKRVIAKLLAAEQMRGAAMCGYDREPRP